MKSIILNNDSEIVGVINGRENCFRFLECKDYKLFIKNINKFEAQINEKGNYGKQVLNNLKPSGSIDTYYKTIHFTDILICEEEVDFERIKLKHPKCVLVNVWRICDF